MPVEDWNVSIMDAALNGRGDVRRLTEAIGKNELARLPAILIALGLTAESWPGALELIHRDRDVYTRLLKEARMDRRYPAIRHALIYLLGQIVRDDTALVEDCISILKSPPDVLLADEEDAELLRRCCSSAAKPQAKPRTATRESVATDSGILEERQLALAYLGARAVDTIFRMEKFR